MRIPFLSMFLTSPFEGLLEHAEKVKECAWAFQEAIECYISPKCETFEELRTKVATYESEADTIKRGIRGHLPIGTLMPVSKFQLFRYIREQDGVLDAVEACLNWISVYQEPGLPSQLQKDFLLLVDAVIEPIEELREMVAQARLYFKNYNEQQRAKVKEIINNLHQQEHNVDQMEFSLKSKIFNMELDAVSIFHLVRLVEIVGSIADHAENAGDMMRAMIAK
ncbi:MAG: TIGR00153 family protein [Desulfobacteraceae bacterium]|nr:TIGR00153 family protein [Desulfobacteraceae bacterium]